MASAGSDSDVAARVDLLRRLVSDYAASHRYEQAQYTILVLETSTDAECEISPYVGENEALILLAGFTSDAGWHVQAASCGSDSAWLEWLLRLAPNNPAQWTARIERTFDDIASGGGHVTIDKMSRALSIGPAEVAVLVRQFLPGAKVVDGKVTRK